MEAKLSSGMHRRAAVRTRRLRFLTAPERWEVLGTEGTDQLVQTGDAMRRKSTTDASIVLTGEVTSLER